MNGSTPVIYLLSIEMYVRVSYVNGWILMYIWKMKMKVEICLIGLKSSNMRGRKIKVGRKHLRFLPTRYFIQLKNYFFQSLAPILITGDKSTLGMLYFVPLKSSCLSPLR